jgi:type III secretion protein V
VGGAVIDLLHALHLAACALVAALALRGSVAALPRALIGLLVGRLALELAATGSLVARGDAGTLARALGGAHVGAGVAVFGLLTVAQVALVAAGGERAAEVAARFSLDALPGRQMAVDADLRAGAVTPELAGARRDALLDEATARGAMDGAFRFVKGDALAGVAVALVNLLVGAAAAALSRGVPLRDAVERFASLAVGQGLAARVPAVLVAGAAAVAVTRPARDEHPAAARAGLVAGALVTALAAIVPGVRAWPFALVAVACAVGASLRRASPSGAPTFVFEAGVPAAAPFEAAMREALDALGLPLGIAVVRAGGATLRVHGLAVATAGAPEVAWLRAAVRSHAWRAVGVDEARAMLDGAAREAPTLVRSLVTAHGLPALAEVLRRLVRERVSVKPLRAVLEAVERAGAERDPAVLAERVRVALGPVSLEGEAWMVDPVIASALRDLARPGATAGEALIEDVVRAVRAAVGDEAAPVLVVEQPLRRRLRAVLERDLPEARVIGLDELAEAPARRGWVRPV